MLSKKAPIILTRTCFLIQATRTSPNYKYFTFSGAHFDFIRTKHGHRGRLKCFKLYQKERFIYFNQMGCVWMKNKTPFLYTYTRYNSDLLYVVEPVNVTQCKPYGQRKICELHNKRMCVMHWGNTFLEVLVLYYRDGTSLFWWLFRGNKRECYINTGSPQVTTALDLNIKASICLNVWRRGKWFSFYFLKFVIYCSLLEFERNFVCNVYSSRGKYHRNVFHYWKVYV